MALNLLTVDLEEWFVVEALSSRFSRRDWPALPSTLERNCDRLLRLFDRHGVRATFFSVGWCAERLPDMMRRIAEAGHEIGCHGYIHGRVNQMTPGQFREDTRRVLDVLTEVCKVRPVGYRAPSWSIDDTVPWALEILAELGFEYDSSIFPIKHDLYGMPDGPRELFRMSFDAGRFLYELPASTIRVWGHNLPIGGGGYLRHSPYWYTRRLMHRLNRSGLPVVVYVHPWEIDPDPPPIKGLSALQKLRTYGSTDTLEYKLDRLISEFEFVTVLDYIRKVTRQRIGFER
jgi:polysaccharide deacetylase family protein (PEP-CTERM system associated)